MVGTIDGVEMARSRCLVFAKVVVTHSFSQGEVVEVARGSLIIVTIESHHIWVQMAVALEWVSGGLGVAGVVGEGHRESRWEDE